MSIRRSPRVLGLLVFLAGRTAFAEPLAAAPATTTAGSEQIQAAPGGGEMVILGPELTFVTRGSIGPNGDLHVGCARDPGSVESPSVQPPASAWPGAR